MEPTDYTHLLKEDTYCFDLDNIEAGGHDLYDLAVEDGHASLKSMLNDYNAWANTVADVAKILIEEKV